MALNLHSIPRNGTYGRKLKLGCWTRKDDHPSREHSYKKETKLMKGLRESKMRAKINLEVSVTCFLNKPTWAVAWHSITFLLRKCRIFYYTTTFFEEQLAASPFCAPSNLPTVFRLLGLQTGSYDPSLPKLYYSEKNIVLEANNFLKRLHVW